MDLRDVLWIGGGQGSGKSSIARALSRRFDLQLYDVDEHTAAHEPRMPSAERGSPSLASFLTASRHRFRIVLEDLRGLPDSPMAVVEGRELLPTSVAAVLREPDHALFLVPAGGAGGELDLLVARDARDLRLTALPVDRPLDELIALAVEHFRPAVERGAQRRRR